MNETPLTDAVLLKAEDPVMRAYHMRLLAERLELAASTLATALGDALSTFRDDDKTTIITVERQEAWKAALEDYRRIRP
jgi:hypothetical protein